MFVSSGATNFTKEPENPFLVVEGDNITLEWGYTFGESESYLSTTFQIGSNVVVNKFLGAFFMANSYQGRLHANINNSYTSITLLGVKRSEMGNFTLKVSSQPKMVSTSTTVEISVLCKYKVPMKTRLQQHTKKIISAALNFVT